MLAISRFLIKNWEKHRLGVIAKPLNADWGSSRNYNLYNALPTDRTSESRGVERQGEANGRGAGVSQAGTRLASQTLTIIFDKYMLLIPVSQIRHLLPRMVVGWL